MKILISKIKLNPQQPRTVFGEEEMKTLSESIKSNGLEQPIQVKDNGDGTYTLVDGERRLRAHQLLGEKEIESFVKGKMTEENSTELLISALAANLAHDGLNPVDEAVAYHKLRHPGHGTKGMSVREIARACGTTTNNVYSKMKINGFTDEERELMKQGRLPVEDEAIDALLSVPDERQRIKISKRLAERNASTAIVRKVCESFIRVKRQLKTSKQNKKAGRSENTLAVEPLQNEPPEWDALYQAGRVPPWKLFTESVMGTCDACSLRPVASVETCASCPLVSMVEKMLESVK